MSLQGICKKGVRLNKHIYTKHTKQNCKVIDLDFETSIAVIDKSINEKMTKERDKKNMARNQKTRMKIIFQLKRVNLSVLLFLRILVNLPVFIFFLIFQLFPPVLLITTNYFIHD